MITPETASKTLSSWLAYPQITQETATQLITRAFLAQSARPEIAVYRIEREDGTVDYDAWRRNRINIFQRWRKLETAEHREKFSALIPAILEAIRKSAPELHKQITAGHSPEYLLSQLLKKPQWQARSFLVRRWRILNGSVTRPYMRYRRYAAAIASSTRGMTSDQQKSQKSPTGEIQ
ncbi:hypothetical protein H0L72_003291 [Salmonella enterica]|nr:hypothetical protein [Salmonella enterica]